MSSNLQTLGAALVLCLLGALPARAANNFDLDPERIGASHAVEGPQWREGGLKLPVWPRDADLVEWRPEGAQEGLRYFIDTASLQIDDTGEVVRYTLVIQPEHGTRNVSFEGIHCSLRSSYKVYAYGIDGRFDRAPPGDWLPISELGHEAFRDDLRRHRFCVPRESATRPVKDMIRALRGRVSASESTGFQAD